MKNINLYKDILDVLQMYVDKNLEHYDDAEFVVSLLQDLGQKDRPYDCIVLTINT